MAQNSIKNKEGELDMSEFAPEICEQDGIYMPEIEPCDECESFEERLTDVENQTEILETLTQALQDALEDKQDALEAGNYIEIVDNVISAVLSDFYTSAQVDALIAAASTLKFEVVESLPATGSPTTIYLLDNGSGYDQYIYTDGEWVMIGTTAITIDRSTILAALGVTSMADLMCPVGGYLWTSREPSVYDPNLELGGTWELMDEGMTLVSAGQTYTISTGTSKDGGSEYIQAHTHSFSNPAVAGHRHSVFALKDGASGSSKWTLHNSSASGAAWFESTSNGASTSGGAVGAVAGATTGNEGNMPPYKNAYCWHRTA